MKKTFFLLAAGVSIFTAHAQTPANRSMAIVEKATATWCGPCGQWGWTLQEGLIDDNMVGPWPKAMVIATHGSLGSYHTGTADSLIRGWLGSGIPEWAVNNVKKPASRLEIKKAVDSFAAKPPVASTGFTYTISGNTITVNTKSRFWKAANGTYALGVYILEDSAFGEQTGKPTNVYHRYVLRGRMSVGVFGDEIASGGIAVNHTVSKNFSFNITRTDWNKSKLKILTVIWKKNGTNWNSWEFVNANAQTGVPPAGTGSLPAAVEGLAVYPNPSADRVRICGRVAVASDVRLSITNAAGQTMFERLVPYGGRELAEDIVLDGLANGVYMLSIQAEGAQTVQKLVVAR